MSYITSLLNAKKPPLTNLRSHIKCDSHLELSLLGVNFRSNRRVSSIDGITPNVEIYPSCYHRWSLRYHVFL